ncbi:hypothetical protein AVEN_35291-1 [Araneus ventricosus]|uniref:Uncharacterized protein n=1 Tax=Araneus ventricosus TaxID=182803 RepID=A0A4Y2PZX8_ARAVE|nr:hypothetical protein AVEN_35291-1 [Araneus ventricosus]
MPPPATAQLLRNEEVRPIFGMKVTHSHTITIPPGEARTHLLIRRLLIHLLAGSIDERLSSQLSENEVGILSVNTSRSARVQLKNG